MLSSSSFAPFSSENAWHLWTAVESTCFCSFLMRALCAIRLRLDVASVAIPPLRPARLGAMRSASVRSSSTAGWARCLHDEGHELVPSRGIAVVGLLVFDCNTWSEPQPRANYLASRLAEEQRADARRARAAVVAGENLVHLDPTKYAVVGFLLQPSRACFSPPIG
jgi:hypothetical protein